MLTQKMEKENDLRNIKKYVKKEMRNEQAYRMRLDNANTMQARNVSHLAEKQVEGSQE